MLSSAGLPPEVNVDPLGDIVLKFLIDRDSEETFIDFKETLSIAHHAPFAKIAKDIFAFSNYGGGIIILGFREKKETDDPTIKRRFIPVGLSKDYTVDQADLQQKFNSYVNTPISLKYREFSLDITGTTQKFAAIYIPPSTSVLKPIKSGEYIVETKHKVAFKVGEVLFRRGTQSVPASKEEITWIEKRSKNDGYRLSILSGKPDYNQETLYSNLFEVIKMPEKIYICSQISSTKDIPLFSDIKYTVYENKIITIKNLNDYKGQLKDYIDQSSIRTEPVNEWLDDYNKSRVIVRLLNYEIEALVEKIGLLHEPHKNKFYFACDGEHREESWKPRFRTYSTLTVAQKRYIQQLKRSIYYHTAINAKFGTIAGRLYLILNPTIQLTEDGKKGIFGASEGTVITRLTHNKYNSAYLNSILFWAYKLANGKDNIEFLDNDVLVSANPTGTKINVSILSDRPVHDQSYQEI